MAFVVGSLGQGGTEAQLVRLAKELSAVGCEVRVFAIRGGALDASVRASTVRLQTMLAARGQPNRSPLSRLALGVVFAVMLCYWFARWRPDVCHAFLYEAYVLAIPAATVTGVTCRVIGRRGMPEGEPSGLVYDALRAVANRLSTATIANSRAIANALVAQGDDGSKIHVIPNGVDMPPEPAQVDRQPPVAMVVANLIAYKGHADLVEALRIMENPPTTHLIGDGPEREALEAAVRAAGLHDVVLFRGAHKNAAEQFSEAQLAILCSHQEGMPNAVLEAMAAGVPVIATAVGGTPELVIHEVNGLLVPPRDPSALARAIASLASDPALRLRLGAAARNSVEARDWSRCTRAHLNLYNSLLGGSEARPSR